MNTPTELHATTKPRVDTRTGLDLPYLLFSITLLLAAALTLAPAGSWARSIERAAFRWCGRGVG